MQAQCPKCQAAIDDVDGTTKFCPNCGNNLADDASAGPSRALQVFASLRPVLLPVGVVALAAAIAWGYVGKSDETTRAEKEVKRLEKRRGEIDKETGRADRKIASLEKDVGLVAARADKAAAALEKVKKLDDRLSGDPAAELKEIKEEVDLLTRERDERKEKAKAKASKPAVAKRPAKDKGLGSAAHFETFQQAVVTVFAGDRPVATGLVVGKRDTTRYVVTVSSAVPHGTSMACLFKTSAAGGKEFAAAPADLVYRDEESRLALLACSSDKKIATRVIDLAKHRASAPGKGDKVFSIGTQVVGTTAFSDNVIDGTISATERKIGDVNMLQTTVPANPGSVGSPIVNAKGGFVGVLLEQSEGLERTSIAVPALLVSPVLEQMKTDIARGAGGGVDYTPPTIGEMQIKAAGKAHPLPYKEEDSFELAGPCGDDLVVFPGPSDMVVVWDKDEESISAHKRGRPRPLWQNGIRVQGNPTVAYDPWGPRLLMASEVTEHQSTEFNLKMGTPVGRIPVIHSVLEDEAIANPWANFKIGAFRILALERGFAIVSLKSAKGFNLDFELVLMARNEDLFTFSTPDGELGWFTQSGFLPILGRIGSAIDRADRIIASGMSPQQKYDAIQKLAAQVKALAAELRNGVTFYDTDGVDRDLDRPRESFSHIPGTYKHIIGSDIFKIGPERVTYVGELAPIRHSCGDEPWFYAYYEADAQLCAAASPDGKYAVTDTHVYDLKKLKPIVELPFPTGPAGFTASGSHIYAFDRLNCRIVFIDVKELLRTGRGPWGRARN